MFFLCKCKFFFNSCLTKQSQAGYLVLTLRTNEVPCACQMETFFKQKWGSEVSSVISCCKTQRWRLLAGHTLSDDWMSLPSHNVSAPNVMYINVLMHPNIDTVSELFSAEFSLYLLLLIDLGQPRSAALIWTVYTFLISHFFSYWRKDWEWKSLIMETILTFIYLIRFAPSTEARKKNVLQYQNIEEKKISILQSRNLFQCSNEPHHFPLLGSVLWQGASKEIQCLCRRLTVSS